MFHRAGQNMASLWQEQETLWSLGGQRIIQALETLSERADLVFEYTEPAGTFTSSYAPHQEDTAFYIIVQLAEGLLEADPGSKRVPLPRHLDVAALKRAREYLDTQKTRVVHSVELEMITGLTRYDLARQFRMMCGTSPYRYLLMRRLAYARELLARSRSQAEVAIEAGFADQAHFSRMFKATFSITSAQYRALNVLGTQP